MTEEEQLFAWLDGELGEAEAVKFAERVRTNPQLRELADQHRALKHHLNHAFDPIADRRVPYVQDLTDDDDESESKQA